MFQVGDQVTHAAFLAALTQSHGYDTRIEVWRGGELVGEIGSGQWDAGAVSVNATNRERRSLDLTVAESLWPATAADLLTPYGAWLRAVVTITAGTTVFPDIPVFAGLVMSPSRNRWSGRVDVKAVDPMWQVNRESFETPRSAPVRRRIVDLIGSLLREVFPAASITDLTGSTEVVPSSGLMWDAAAGSRGKAIDELAAAIGAEVFARPTTVWPGGDFVIRPVPGLAGDPDWWIPDGHARIVVGDQLSQTREDVTNRWIVMVERTDGAAPIYAVATDTDPASPTRYGGDMGRLPDFYSSPLISTQGQAATVAAAKLRRSLGLGRARSVELMANPALEGGDILGLGVDGEPYETHIADTFTIPLTADPASMTVQTRSTVTG